MMTMKTIGILTLVFTSSWGQPHEPQETWHAGEVVLSDGSTLQGPLSYDLTYEVVKLKLGNQLRVFNAVQVAGFKFTDTTCRLSRSFYSLPYRMSADYHRLLFFELLAEGELSLFARERSVLAVPVVDPMPGMYATPVWQTVYDLYATDRSGSVYALWENPEETILWLMQDQRDAMARYMKAKKPVFSDTQDMADLFVYYRTLTSRLMAWVGFSNEGVVLLNRALGYTGYGYNIHPIILPFSKKKPPAKAAFFYSINHKTHLYAGIP